MPTPEEREGLQDDIRTILTANQDLANARSLEGLLRGNSAQGPQWRKAMDDIERLDKLLKSKLEAVIFATQQTYGIGFPVTANPQGGVFKNQTTTFRPQIIPTDEAFLDAKIGQRTVHLHWRYDPTGIGSDTLDDGQAIISIRVLQRCLKNGSPAALAVAIDHEYARWSQLTGPGWIAKSHDQYEAYGHELDTATRIGLEEDEVKAIEALRAPHWATAMGTSLSMALGLPYKPGPSSGGYAYSVKPGHEGDGFKDWEEYQGRLASIRQQQNRFREALGHSGPNPDDGRQNCGEAAAWVVDGVVIPGIPCPEEIPAPTPGYADAAPAHALPSGAVAHAEPAKPERNPWHTLSFLAVSGCSASPEKAKAEFEAEWAGLRFSIGMYPDAAETLGLAGCSGRFLTRLMALAATHQELSWTGFLREASVARQGPSDAGSTDFPGGNPTEPSGPCAEHGSFGVVRTGCRN